MGDMVERVKARLLPIIQDGIPGDMTDDVMADALGRAAIAALREPTEEMVQRATNSLEDKAVSAGDWHWRPIETAPRDGTEVLLYDPEGTNVFEGGKVVGRVPYRQIGHFLDGVGWLMVDEQCGGDFRAEPTHWMPLLEAPK